MSTFLIIYPPTSVFVHVSNIMSTFLIICPHFSVFAHILIFITIYPQRYYPKEAEEYKKISPHVFLDPPTFKVYGGSFTPIGDHHQQALSSCPFVHYLDLVAILTDQTTFQKIVPEWDEKSRRFRFAGSRHAFTTSWIRSHTFLPTVGVSVKKNTEETLLWRKYFSGKS